MVWALLLLQLACGRQKWPAQADNLAGMRLQGQHSHTQQLAATCYPFEPLPFRTALLNTLQPTCNAPRCWGCGQVVGVCRKWGTSASCTPQPAGAGAREAGSRSGPNAPICKRTLQPHCRQYSDFDTKVLCCCKSLQAVGGGAREAGSRSGGACGSASRPCGGAGKQAGGGSGGAVGAGAECAPRTRACILPVPIGVRHGEALLYILVDCKMK